jgi:hypothetical protein
MLTPTGHKAITRSRSRVQTSINRLSLRSSSSSSMRQSPNNCPGYPRDRLSMVKHRQLARQVGTFRCYCDQEFDGPQDQHVLGDGLEQPISYRLSLGARTPTRSSCRSVSRCCTGASSRSFGMPFKSVWFNLAATFEF